jgi:hypothetical protein
LIEALFADDPRKPTDALADNPNIAIYLSRLMRLGIRTASMEPDRLKAEEHTINRQMEDFAFDHFGSFISGASCTESMRQQMEKLVDSSDNVATGLSDLSAACHDFCRRVKGISKARKVNHKTLRQHGQLLELLELSQLMDTCVQNQHYDEALELQHHALRLANQHQDIPVIRMIAEEIKHSTTAMQLQLHQLLCGQITLPGCLRLIGFLKRLGLYSNWELRIVYLQCRGRYLAECLALIPSTNHYAYISKVIDVTRSQLSEITTQYRAIFDQEDEILPATANRDPLGSTTQANGASGGPGQSSLTASYVQVGMGTGSTEDVGSILQCWLLHHIDSFVLTLESKLPLIPDGTGISNLLSQCMYFGLSMGRLGADFRSVLVPIFEKAILRLAQGQLAIASEVFAVQLKRYRPILGLTFAVPSSTTETTTSSSSANQGASSSGQPTAPEGSTTTESAASFGSSSFPKNPPLVIMDHMPLAHLTNLLIGTLNELRKCCPYSLATQITSAFEATLLESVEQLANFRAQMEGDSEQDKKCFSALCKTYSEDFLPFVLGSYDALWKSQRRMIAEEKIRHRLALLTSQ